MTLFEPSRFKIALSNKPFRLIVAVLAVETSFAVLLADMHNGKFFVMAAAMLIKPILGYHTLVNLVIQTVNIFLTHIGLALLVLRVRGTFILE